MAEVGPAHHSGRKPYCLPWDQPGKPKLLFRVFVSALASPSLQSSASSLLSFAPWLTAPGRACHPQGHVGDPRSWRSSALLIYFQKILTSSSQKKQFIPKLAFPDTKLSFNRNRKNFFCSVPICFECFLPYIPHCRATHEALPFQLSILEKLEITLL